MTGQTKTEELTVMDWARGLGSGLIAGAAFVAVAMLVEKEVVKAGIKPFLVSLIKPTVQATAENQTCPN